MTLTADFNPNVAVPFSRMRYLLQESGGLQAGVVGATDVKVVQRGAGANMSVDVGTGGAWVQATTGTRNGLVHCFNDATANVVVTASNATNPRIDQIYLRYNDSSIPTGSGDIPTLAVATGTATAGATLDNRTGAVALPADSLRLADILVPATSTSVVDANIRDRRPWARGACYVKSGTGGGNHTTTNTTATALAAGVYNARLECSGAPMTVRFEAVTFHSALNGIPQINLRQDGALLMERGIQGYAASAQNETVLSVAFTPPAGSRLFEWYFYGSIAGTTTVANQTTNNPVVTYREQPGQNANNGTA